jgi:hypothetical protein
MTEVSDVVRRLLAELAARAQLSDAELRYRLEPLRTERERCVAVLVELLREDGPEQRLAAAALHELATVEDAEALVAATRTGAGLLRGRADLRNPRGRRCDRLEGLLEPQEIHEISLLSIDTLFDWLRSFRNDTGRRVLSRLFRERAPSVARCHLEATNRPTALSASAPR